MANDDFDPTEMGVQCCSSICGLLSSAAMIFGATRMPSHMAIKAYGGAAVGIAILCVVCCLSMKFGAERAANQLPGQGD